METTALQVLMRETPLEVLTRAASLVAGCETTTAPDAGRKCVKRLVSSECESQTNLMTRKCRRVGEQGSPTLARVSYPDENEDHENDGGRRSAATQTLFSSFVPFSGFYQLQPTDPVLRDTVPDEEPCLILDLDQHTVKSSHPCHVTPHGPRNTSHASSLAATQVESCNNGPLNLTTAIPSRRTPGPFHSLTMTSDWQGSSMGHCQGEFMPRGHPVAMANCDVEQTPSWGSEKMERQFVNGIKIESPGLRKRTLPYNDPGSNSFAGKTNLRKSKQQETTIRNYTAVETDPNIDEHFRRSLGSDYSRVVNRVDVPNPAAAAAAAATTVSQGRTFRNHIGTVAAVPPSTESCASNAKKSTTASGAVDEHFAKSLGSTWTKIKSENVPSSVLVNASAVDDHFAKALGETWFQLKAGKRSSPSNSSCFV